MAIIFTKILVKIVLSSKNSRKQKPKRKNLQKIDNFTFIFYYRYKFRNLKTKEGLLGLDDNVHQQRKEITRLDTFQFQNNYQVIKSIINSKMKSIDQVVSKVDIFAQPLEINFEPDKKHGIYLPFVATLILVVIITVSTITSLVDLFNYKKVTTTGYRQNELDSTNTTIPMVAFKMHNFTFNQFKSRFQYSFDQVNWKTGTQQGLSFQPCTRNHWKDISEEEYNKFSVSDYYCLTKPDGLYIQSNQIDDLNQEIILSMVPQHWFQSQLQYGLVADILLLNKKSVYKQMLAFENRLKYLTTYASFNSTSRELRSVIMKIPYILKIINDDSSFFPFSSPINRTITTLDLPTSQTRSIKIGSDETLDSFFQIRIYMGLRSIEYERNVGKVTDIFAEAGGLYTSVFGVFSIVVLIYYNHKLRLKLAESTFKNNKNSIKPSDYGFIKSLRYGTRGIAKPNQNSDFGKECKRIEKNLNEVDSLVHIETMLNRLQIIESTLEQSQDKDQFFCSRLLEKSSVKKIQRKRLSIEYYSYIVQGRDSITIRDARKMYNGMGMSLEDFLNLRLKHRRQLLNQNDKEKLKLNEAFQTENCIVDEMESSQRNQTQTFIPFKQNKSGLNTLQKVINQFRNTKTDAEQVEITQEFAKIEVNLAKAFYKMNEKSRAKKQQKIPIIILHRLMKAIQHMRMKNSETKHEGESKAEKIKEISNKEEEEQSDSSESSDEND